MPRLNPTVDELVSTLRRSKLPTVVVEGRDDMQIFRWMEDLLVVHEVDEFLAGRDYKFDHHCNEIVHLGQTEMDDDFRQRRGFRLPNSELEQQIREAYQLQLRGKQLFQMLVRFLSESNRRVKHSLHGLYEIAFKMTPFHPLMDRLIQEIERKIAAHSLTP